MRSLNEVESSWDVAIIGGGPAGLMAAACAAQRGRKTILFDKNMLNPGLAGMGKNLLPIDNPLAHGHERIRTIGRRRILRARGVALLEVLDVEHREAAGIALEIRHRINTRVKGPENVHLHLQQFRIAARKHDVITAGVIRAGKLTKMRVVAPSQSIRLHRP